MSLNTIRTCLPHLEKELLLEIEEHAVEKTYEVDKMIIQQGQFIRFLPIVLKGSVKIYSTEESTQFMMYYISAGSPCIFSFAHVINSEPIAFSAITESESELLLLPIHKVQQWIKQYVSFSNLLLSAYQKHYNDLLEATKQITCYNLEERLLTYLISRSKLEDNNLLATTHQEIADDLGTSREVITRLVKKLSINNKIMQVGRKIKVIK